MATWRPRSEFVEDLLGVPEQDFRRQPDLVRKAWHAPSTLQNLSTQRTFECGQLSLPSLGSLRKTQASIEGDRHGFLTILQATNDIGKLDVGYLQSQRENHGALFQVASNFNGLELMNRSDKRAMTEIGNYIFDRTQGPYASISAAPGLVLRHYYPFFSNQNSPNEWRQVFEGRQIELLGETDLSVTNGYLEIRPEDLNRELDENLLKVVHHRNIQVTFGGARGSEHLLLERNDQRIDQVFTATADLAWTNQDLFHKEPRQTEKLIKKLLTSAYEGTLRSAIQSDRKRVFLTLIGGGVFANPPEWIVDVLEDQLPLIIDSGLSVFLNTFRGIGNVPVFERLVGLAQRSGGTLVTY
jgi:hypothetical protein